MGMCIVCVTVVPGQLMDLSKEVCLHTGTDWFLTVFIRQSKGCKGRSGIRLVVIIIMAVGLFLQYFILICLITLAFGDGPRHYVYKHVTKTLITTEWSVIFTSSSFSVSAFCCYITGVFCFQVFC